MFLAMAEAVVLSGPDLRAEQVVEIVDLLPRNAQPTPPLDQPATQTDTDTDRGPERLRAGRERSFARRVAAKAVEIAAAPEPDRKTLAGLLGCPADVVTLTAEVMGAPRGAATRAVSDLDSIAAADPMEAPIKVATLSRDRQRALWNLLASLGVAGSTPPLNEFKQALAAAKAVFAVDAATRKRLAGAVTLARVVPGVLAAVPAQGAPR